MTITEFLLARIAEDEALARAADGSRWRGEDKGITFDVYSDKFDDGEAMARLEADTRANQDHIINWSPPRVLAECAAKRTIVEDFRDLPPIPESVGQMEAGEWVCRELAAVYADHEDFDQSWLVT